jgi:uncharacterized protein with ParB-like and HNH nuclease domain
MFNPPIQLSVGKFFTDLYKIPDYQRPYMWIDEQINDLFDDLEDAINNAKPEYFLGSVITVSAGNNSFDIIDGQQRITTLTLIFAVISYLCKQRKIHSTEDDIGQESLEQAIYRPFSSNATPRLNISVWNINNYDFVKALQLECSTVVKPTRKDLGDDYLVEKKYANTLFIAYERLSQKSNTDLQKFINYLFKQVSLLRIDCNSRDDALKLFQTLNARGLELSAADIFKVFLMIKNHNLPNPALRIQDNKFISDWESIRKDANAVELELLDLMYIISDLLSPKGTDNNVEKDLEGVFSSYPDVQSILDKIRSILKEYEKIYNSKSPIVYSMFHLIWRHWTSVFILIETSNFSQTQKDELKNKIFQLFYITWFADHGVDRARKYLRNMREKINNYNDTLAYITSEIQPLKKIALDNLIGSEVYPSKWSWGLLAVIEYFNTDPLPAWIEYGQGAKVQIEHILPQHPAENAWQDFNQQARETLTNSGANLMLITGGKNKSAYNYDFPTKVKAYLDNGAISYTTSQKVINDFGKDSAGNPEWSISTLEKRKEWYIQQVRKIFDI